MSQAKATISSPKNTMHMIEPNPANPLTNAKCFICVKMFIFSSINDMYTKIIRKLKLRMLCSFVKMLAKV